MNWDKETYDLKRIKEKTSHQIAFKYLGDKEIDTATSSCGCSTPTIEGNVVRVIYTSGEVPKHIIKEGKNEYETTKSIKVKFKDTEEFTVLRFTAIVERLIRRP